MGRQPRAFAARGGAAWRDRRSAGPQVCGSRNNARRDATTRLEVLRNLAHEALEGQLADEQLRGLLVLANLAARRARRSKRGRIVSTVCVVV
jgi:hypothetical protein